MILLADDVLDGRSDQKRFGAIDLTIRRNGYGRQAASFECDLAVSGLGPDPVHAVFIRAPVVERAGPDVEVLATLPEPVTAGVGAGSTDDGRAAPADRSHPVVCRQGSVLVAAFHPELTGDRRLHELFVAMTKEDQEERR
jgi:5'-phosphate synthase pdxT subunit